MSVKYFRQTLPDKTAKLIEDLQNGPTDFLESFYLSGGTALSLQIGHRESEDLDFFPAQPFDPLKLQEQISKFGPLSQVEIARW